MHIEISIVAMTIIGHLYRRIKLGPKVVRHPVEIPQHFSGPGRKRAPIPREWEINLHYEQAMESE